MPVKGLEGTLQLLDQWDAALQREVMTEAAVAGAEIIANAARALAPVDNRPKARHRGALARNILVEIRKSAKLREGYVVVGPNCYQFYGYFLEFGTKRMRPRPWFGPALALVRERAYAAIEEVIRARLLQLQGQGVSNAA